MRRTVAGLAVLALALTGCGTYGGGADGDSDGSPTPLKGRFGALDRTSPSPGRRSGAQS